MTTKTSTDAILEQIRDVGNIRVRRDGGFYGVTKPVMFRLPGSLAFTSYDCFSTPFFTADRPYRVVSVIERHERASTDGSARYLMLKRVPSGTAPGSGISVLTANLDLWYAADTNQKGAIDPKNDTLQTGDSLSVILTAYAPPTNLLGVSVAVLLRSL